MSGFATVVYLIALGPIVLGAMLLFLAIGSVLLLGIGDRQTAKTLQKLPTIVPAGIPITAIGVPRRDGDGAVLEPWLGFSGVTMSSFEELRQRKVDESRDTWSMSRGLATWGIVISGIGWMLYLVSMSVGWW